MPLLIASINNNIYITDLYCTHEQTSLEEGFIDKCHVVCSNHFAEFDPKTGKAVAGPEGEEDSIKDLKSYRTKIENDTITVDSMDNLYVCFFGGSHVLNFDRNGKLIKEIKVGSKKCFLLCFRR